MYLLIILLLKFKWLSQLYCRFKLFRLNVLRVKQIFIEVKLLTKMNTILGQDIYYLN